MRKPRLLKNYARLSEQNLAFRAQMVIVNLTGNPSFPVTVPSLADFTVVKNTYTQALEDCADGDKTAIALKNQAKNVLLTWMDNLANNVQSLAQNDRAKMVSSGFEMASDGESSPPLSSPENFTVTEGLNKGELRLSIKGDSNAIAYVFEYTEEPPTENSIWNSRPSSIREHTLTGLRSGTRIYVRAGKVGRKNQYVYSEVLSRIVQ